MFPEYPALREKCALDYCCRCDRADVLELRDGGGLFDPPIIIYVRGCYCPRTGAK